VTALQTAVRWLARRDYSVADLRARLESKGFAEPDIAAALETLERRHFLDDARLAERVTELGHRAGKGGHAINAKLQKQGLETSPPEPSDELARAEALVDKNAAKWTSAPQVARALASRGFDEEIVRSLLESRFPDLDS
jgi:regulatory protein